METVKGFVNHITYRNEQNGYTVLKLEREKGQGMLTCTGLFPVLSEGELLELDGDFTEHPTYGRQFAVTASRHCEPSDELSIQRYLGSGAIKGVGPSLAERIVKTFGEDSFRIIEDEPERLAEIKGISERMAQRIATQVEEQKDMRDAMMFLEQYGISNALAAKIYDYYNQNVYQIIRENPYDLMEHVEGIGFARADEIARRVGFTADADCRIESGIFYTLMQSVSEGNIFMYLDELAVEAQKTLGFQVQDLMHYLSDLDGQRKIKLEEEPSPDPEAPATRLRVYTRRYYDLEFLIARQLLELSFFDEDLPEEVLMKQIKTCEGQTDLTLNEDQRSAVAAAARNGISILTGGPGTGKTTTICVMIAYFMGEHEKVLLAAPTGRAAKRMSQATGYEAKTIHRLLEVSGDPEGGLNPGAGPGEGRMHFERNQDNPLDADVIIIDEMSMVDLDLMYALLDAVEPGTRLVLVGDDSQLPSVGPGSVLKDLIASGSFPNVQLTTIYRQGAGSDIAKNASLINQGQLPDLRRKSQDFFFVRRENARELTSYLLHIVSEGVPRYLSISPYDVQVLSPMHAGALGVEELNRLLQETLNPPDPGKKQEKEAGSRIFREGDKVMQIKNNYQLQWEVKDAKRGISLDSGEGVFNGDMGIIRSIEPSTVTVEFDEGHLVEYSPELLDELELAYAITIHKAQGSEYPAVIIPLLDVPTPLMYRNLLYTAITRARRCVILLGSEEVMARMIHNKKEHERNTSLSQRIKEIL